MEDKDLLIENANETEEINEFVELTKLEVVELKLQEVEIVIDQLDYKMSIEGQSEDLFEEYNLKKDEYKELLKDRKSIIKENKSTLDKLPMWIIIFGVVQLILLFPVGSYYLWMAFANWIISVFSTALDTIASEGSDFFFKLMIVLMIYSLPIVNFFSTWTIYVNYNRQVYAKKVLKWIWIIQTVLTVGMGIYLYFTVIHGNFA